jgi:hypothetical protein
MSAIVYGFCSIYNTIPRKISLTEFIKQRNQNSEKLTNSQNFTQMVIIAFMHMFDSTVYVTSVALTSLKLLLFPVSENSLCGL